MNKVYAVSFAVLLLLSGCNGNNGPDPDPGPRPDYGTGVFAEAWITSPARSILFVKYNHELEFRTLA
ncbi:MAG: hypothetical protein WCD55_06860, partial [Bacteroidales bacterium]